MLAELNSASCPDLSGLDGWKIFLSDAGSVASLIGLLVTFWVAWNVSNIKLHFFAKVRLPQYQKALEKAASALSDAMGQTRQDESSIQRGLSELRAHVKSVKKNVPGSLRGDFKALDKAIEAACKAGERREADRLLDIYAKTVSCATSLRNYIADTKWSDA